MLYISNDGFLSSSNGIYVMAHILYIANFIGWETEVDDVAGKLFIYKLSNRQSVGVFVSFSLTIQANFE